MRDKPKSQIVRHPQGGWTLAVPLGNGSTTRIYQGHWNRRPTMAMISGPKLRRAA